MMVDAFKREIRCYRDLQNEKRKYENELDNLWYRLSGVKAIGYDGVKGVTDERQAEQMKLDILEKIDQVETEIKRCELQIRHLDGMLERIEPDTRQAIIEIYVHRQTYSQVAKKHNMSSSGLQGRINKEINRVI